LNDRNVIIYLYSVNFNVQVAWLFASSSTLNTNSFSEFILLAEIFCFFGIFTKTYEVRVRGFGWKQKKKKKFCSIN